MKILILTSQIVKKEKLTNKEKQVLIKVCQKNIFTEIKGKDLPKHSTLIKIYTTTLEGARRIVLLLDEKEGMGYFLFFRKKDDSLGKNISIKNPAFKNTLVKYLHLIDEDIENDKFEVVKL